MEEGEPIEHGLVSRAIQTAQKRVEAHHFEIRKHLLEYDDVMNKQREVVYGMRREILQGESQEETVREWMDEALDGIVDTYAGEASTPRTGIWRAGRGPAPAVRREASRRGGRARGRLPGGAAGGPGRGRAGPVRGARGRAVHGSPAGRSSGG